jgi:hypothetical protein
MPDDLLAIISGSVTVVAIKAFGFISILHGFDTLLLGMLGGIGGYLGKLIITCTINHIKTKLKKNNPNK